MELPDELTIDLDSLTLGDLEDGERLAGDAFRDALAGKAGIGAQALVALLYISLRKDHPAITIEDVRGLGLPVLSRLKVTGGDAANPTEPAGAGG